MAGWISRTILSATLVVGCSGCSLFMRTPPDKLPDSPAEHIHCTTSLGAPVVDAVLAGMMGYTAIYIATDEMRGHTEGDNRTADIAIPIVLGGATVAYLLSSAIGYGNATRCVEMKAIQKDRQGSTKP